MEDILFTDRVLLEHDLFQSAIKFVLSRLSEDAHELDGALALRRVLEDFAPISVGLSQEFFVSQL